MDNIEDFSLKIKATRAAPQQLKDDYAKLLIKEYDLKKEEFEKSIVLLDALNKYSSCTLGLMDTTELKLNFRYFINSMDDLKSGKNITWKDYLVSADNYLDEFLFHRRLEYRKVIAVEVGVIMLVTFNVCYMVRALINKV